MAIQKAHSLLMCLGMTVATASLAQPSFQKKGFIQNQDGEKCWYTQTTAAKGTHFHGSLPGVTGTATFDDSSCMSEGELGQDVNVMMVNNMIARWHSGVTTQADAAFRTRADELMPTSTLQKRGKCMQSAKYPGIGVMVDYEMAGGSIVRVHHGQALQGCTR